MLRTQATKLLRECLDNNGLAHWHIRLTTDLVRDQFMGMCSHKDKCIILNAHHIDTNPDIAITNTIYHEVAHALTPGESHSPVWAAKAKELGCDSALPCSTFELSETAIDAIRSGAQLKVTYEERTEIIRTPKYEVTRLQDKCIECGKIAKEKSSLEVRITVGKDKGKIKRIITLECGHIVIKNADYYSPFESLIFDNDTSCNHEWGIERDYTTCKKCPARRLFPFQVEGARQIEKANGRFAVLDQMRLGKTIQALAYLKFHKQDAWPFLWITPASTIYQHFKEIARVLGDEAYPYIINTSKTKPIPEMNAIASYDIFRRMDTLEPFFGFKTIILDEVQAVKNPDSTRTQCIRRIVKEIPKVIPLSGSFWKNRGSEAFVMLNMLDPKMFHSYKHFKDYYVQYEYHGNRTIEGGFINPEKFREKISHIAIRRERKDVAAWLPTINRMRLITQVPEHAREAYRKEEDKLIAAYNDAVQDGTEDSFMNKAQEQKTIMVMRQIVAIAKVPATLDLAKEFIVETGRNLCVFVHHDAVHRMLVENLNKWAVENELPHVLHLHSGLNPFERGHLIEQFNNSKGNTILVASTLMSAGFSITSCQDIIMHERQWNPMNEAQAEDRFPHFDAKAESINATYVHAEDTTDTILDPLVERKRKAFESSMNKDGYVNTWDVDLTGEVVKAIIQKRKKK